VRAGAISGFVYVTARATVGVELCDCQVKEADLSEYNRLGYEVREEGCNFDVMLSIVYADSLDGLMGFMPQHR
jgi:hypothetical protein